MPRKSRKKKPEATSEPASPAAVAPPPDDEVYRQIVSGRTHIEPDAPRYEPEETVATEQKLSHNLTGYRNLMLHSKAGIVARISKDGRTVAVAFDDDNRPSREECDFLRQNGYEFAARNMMWQRENFDGKFTGGIEVERLAQYMAGQREAKMGVGR